MAKKEMGIWTADFIIGAVAFFLLRRILNWGFIEALFVALGVIIFIYLIIQGIKKMMGLPTDVEIEAKEAEEKKKEIEHKRPSISRLGMTKEEAEQEKIVEEILKKDV